MERAVWQVGSGGEARPYEHLMFKYGVALVGSGTDGRWTPDNPAYEGMRHIRAFAESARPGDFVVVRRGLHQLLGVGVLGEYDHSEGFNDIEGWDLQHYRRVRWLSTDGHWFKHAAFPRTRFSRCNDDKVHRWIATIARSESLELPSRNDFRRLPGPEPLLDPATLEPELERVIEAAHRWDEETWSWKLGSVPSEDELLTHVTVPLLSALGWDPEEIAVKWRYTDLALFTPSPREPRNCQVVIEGKRIGDGLRFAGEQAQRYIRDLGLDKAKLLVTNGINYRLHIPPKFADDDALWANLQRPKESARELFDALRKQRRR